MNALGDILKERKVERKSSAIRNPRDEAIQRFVDRGSLKVWSDRKRIALRLATAEDIAMVLGHIPTEDLHAFYRQCEQARSFSRYFWWALKPKKV